MRSSSSSGEAFEASGSVPRTVSARVRATSAAALNSGSDYPGASGSGEVTSTRSVFS